MEMSGQKFIPEPREIVWKALNDPAILRSCVPGCRSLEKTSDTEMQAEAEIRVGPVAAKFAGKISLSELNAPASYRITGEGQGGVAGFAKGNALVTLNEAEDGTLLTYSVEAQVGGKLAQLGGRLIDATARKLSEAFFDKFAAEIRRQYHADTPEAPAAQPAPAPATAAAITPLPLRTAEPAARSSRVGMLAALAIAAIFAFLWLSERQAGGVTTQLAPEFGAAVQLILIAAVGYLFGRLHERR